MALSHVGDSVIRGRCSLCQTQGPGLISKAGVVRRDPSRVWVAFLSKAGQGPFKATFQSLLILFP